MEDLLILHLILSLERMRMNRQLLFEVHRLQNSACRISLVFEIFSIHLPKRRKHSLNRRHQFRPFEILESANFELVEVL